MKGSPRVEIKTAKKEKAIIIAFFAGARPYFRDFFRSLSAQEGGESFDLLVADDGWPGVGGFLPAKAPYDVKVITPAGSGLT